MGMFSKGGASPALSTLGYSLVETKRDDHLNCRTDTMETRHNGREQILIYGS